MPKRLLHVPTHRRCPEAVVSYPNESLFLAREYGEKIPFLLVESFPAAQVRALTSVGEDRLG